MATNTAIRPAVTMSQPLSAPMSWATETAIGALASASSPRIQLRQSSRHKASDAQTTVGNMIAPAATNNPSERTAASERTTTNRRPDQPARRADQAADCAVPKSVNPRRIPIVPGQVNSGSVEIHRIQPRAITPVAAPAKNPAGITQRGGGGASPGYATQLSIVLSRRHRGGRVSLPETDGTGVSVATDYEPPHPGYRHRLARMAAEFVHARRADLDGVVRRYFEARDLTGHCHPCRVDEGLGGPAEGFAVHRQTWREAASWSVDSEGAYPEAAWGERC